MGNNNFFDQSATFPFQYGLTFIGWGADELFEDWGADELFEDWGADKLFEDWGADELFEDWGADDLLLYEPFFGGGFGGGGGGVSIEGRDYVFMIWIFK